MIAEVNNLYSVVVVDDEYWALQTNVKIFNWEKFGFNVVGATTDAEEAIEIITQKKPDAVFLDINMSGMSGFELIENISFSENIKFIIISAYRKFEFAQKAVSMNVFEYCIKPIRTQEADRVLEKLKRVLDRERNIIDVETELQKYSFSIEKINSVQFKKMLEYIINNVDKKLNLNELASMYSFNPNYCSALFSKYFKCGFSDFVAKIRILNAAKLLQYTDIKIEEIGIQCGFTDYGYFNKVFKKIMGMTPRDYKTANRKDVQNSLSDL